MANRTRKRVHAIRRASDGSAFQKCNLCGVSVAVALADMHDCESKENMKRFKGECMNWNDVKQRFQDQPRSPFRLFMESFLKSWKAGNLIEADCNGFETWRNMSKKADDEADSAEVGKYDKYYEDSSENSGGYESFWSVSSETDILYCDPFPLGKFKSRARASNWEW